MWTWRPFWRSLRWSADLPTGRCPMCLGSGLVAVEDWGQDDNWIAIGITMSFLLLLVRHLLLLAWHLFLVANLVTTSKAPVTTSVALVTTSFLLLLVRHLLLLAWHLFLEASCYY